MTAADGHEMRLWSEFGIGDLQPGCSCGWRHANTFKRKKRAIEAWENHCDVVFYTRTMEGLMPNDNDVTPTRDGHRPERTN